MQAPVHLREQVCAKAKRRVREGETVASGGYATTAQIRKTHRNAGRRIAISPFLTRMYHDLGGAYNPGFSILCILYLSMETVRPLESDSHSAVVETPCPRRAPNGAPDRS